MTAVGAVTLGLLVLILRSWAAGKLPVANDLGTMAIPYRVFLSESLKSGTLPLWWPQILGGYDFGAEGQAGPFHPLHLILYYFLPFIAAFHLDLISPYIAIFAGSYLFFQRWGVSKAAAVWGAFVFTFTGFHIIHLRHPNTVAVIAAAPWLLWATDHLLRPSEGARNPQKWLLAIGLLTASEALSGYPQFLLFSLILELIYVGFCLSLKSPMRSVFAWSAAKAFGLLIGGVQLMGTASSWLESTRLKPTFEFISRGSMHPWNVLQILNPYFFGGRTYGNVDFAELSFYPGIGVFLLAASVVFFQPDDAVQRRMSRWLLVIAALSLFISLGKYNLLYYWYIQLPGMNLFRVPGRYTYFLSFAMAGLSAIAFDPFLRAVPPKLKKASTIWAALLCAGALFAVVLSFGVGRGSISENMLFSLGFSPEEPPAINGLSKVLFGAAIILVFCAAFWLARRMRVEARAAFLVLACLEAFLFQASLVMTVKSATLDQLAAQVSKPPVAAPAVIAPFYSKEPKENTIVGSMNEYFRSITQNLFYLSGYTTTTGYVGLEPRTKLPRTSRIYQLLSGAQAVEAFDQTWQTITPVPEVWFPTKTVVSEDPQSVLREETLTTEAVVSSPVSFDPAANATATVSSPSFREKILTVTSSGPKLCVLRTPYRTGWRARIGEETVQTLAVDGDFLGVLVGAGSHTIRLRYEPDWFRQGGYVSMAGMLGLLLFCFFYGRLYHGR